MFSVVALIHFLHVLLFDHVNIPFGEINTCQLIDVSICLEWVETNNHVYMRMYTSKLAEWSFRICQTDSLQQGKSWFRCRMVNLVYLLFGDHLFSPKTGLQMAHRIFQFTSNLFQWHLLHCASQSHSTSKKSSSLMESMNLLPRNSETTCYFASVAFRNVQFAQFFFESKDVAHPQAPFVRPALFFLYRGSSPWRSGGLYILNKKACGSYHPKKKNACELLLGTQSNHSSRYCESLGPVLTQRFLIVCMLVSEAWFCFQMLFKKWKCGGSWFVVWFLLDICLNADVASVPSKIFCVYCSQGCGCGWRRTRYVFLFV